MRRTSVRAVRVVSLTLELATRAATVASRPACVSACPEKVKCRYMYMLALLHVRDRYQSIYQS